MKNPNSLPFWLVHIDGRHEKRPKVKGKYLNQSSDVCAIFMTIPIYLFDILKSRFRVAIDSRDLLPADMGVCMSGNSILYRLWPKMKALRNGDGFWPYFCAVGARHFVCVYLGQQFCLNRLPCFLKICIPPVKSWIRLHICFSILTNTQGLYAVTLWCTLWLCLFRIRDKIAAAEMFLLSSTIKSHQSVL